jgi:hypothetical protein
MGIVTERITTRPGAEDTITSDRVRIFDVQLSPDAATGPLAHTNGLPKLKTEYPIPLPGNAEIKLFADRYDKAAQSDGTTEVTVVYSTDRAGRLRTAPDTTKPGFVSLSVVNQDAQVNLPMLFSFPLLVPGNVALSQKPAIEDTIYHISETRTIYQCRVAIPFFPFADMDLIRKMNNKLNYINNQYCLFKAGQIHQTEKQAWEISYEWISDPGTGPLLSLPTVQTEPGGPEFVVIGAEADRRRLYTPPSGENKLKLLDPLLSDDEEYVRSPFHTLTYYVTKQMVPVWLQFCPYKIDRLGWQALPGTPVF